MRSRQLDILLALKAQIEGSSVAGGDTCDLVGNVYLGRSEFGDDTVFPFVSILEAPKQDVFLVAEESRLIRLTTWTLLVQGWAGNDSHNPTVPAYALKATVEKRLARVAARTIGGGPKYPDEYRLGGRIADISIGPGVVRPPERGLSSRAFFYLPVRVDYMEDLNDPFVAAPLTELAFVGSPPAIGAIRYDAWDSPSSALTQAEAAALSPLQYQARAPFWATAAGSVVTLPAVTQDRMNLEIVQAAAANLIFWAFLGFAPGDPANGALNMYRSSASRGRLNFCMIEHMDGLYYRGAWLPNVARTIGLMGEPGYQRAADGRRVLFIFSMSSDAQIIDRFGSMDAVQTVLDGIRSQCQAAGVGDPYIVMLDGGVARAAGLGARGADAIGAYATLGAITHPLPFAALAANADKWRSDALVLGQTVVPTMMTGWDFRPRITTPNAFFGSEATGNPNAYYAAPTPSELTAHIAAGRTWAGAHSNAGLGLIYAWNEFTEGGSVCPTYLAADAGGDTTRIAAVAAGL